MLEQDLLRGYSPNFPSTNYSFHVSVYQIAAYTECPAKAYLYTKLGIQGELQISGYVGIVRHKIRQALALQPDINVENLVDTVTSECRWLPPSMVKKEVQTYLETYKRIRVPHTPRKVDVEVEVKAFGISGRIDIVEDGTPVELKLSRRFRISAYIQLAWYAILLEHATGQPVDNGILESLSTPLRVKVEISSELRRAAIRAWKGIVKDCYTDSPALKKSSCHYCNVKRECSLLLG